MDEDTNEKWRRFLLPGAASVIGAGAGLALTKADGLGIDDLAEDLRSKIGSVTGTSESGARDRSTTRSGSRRTLDSKELAQRRRARQQRRKQRAGR